jgi:hypothetical protein
MDLMEISQTELAAKKWEQYSYVEIGSWIIQSKSEVKSFRRAGSNPDKN